MKHFSKEGSTKMSGRGEGEICFGKRDAKLHRKIFGDNITNPVIRRLARRRGVKRSIYEEAHGLLKVLKIFYYYFI